MIDREVVPSAHRGEHRRDDVFRDVVNALAIRAHEMVVVLGIARDVGRDVAVALEAAGHPIFDLLLKRPVHGGTPDRGVGHPDPLVQLLRRQGALRGREGLRDHHTLGRPAPAAGGEACIDGCRGHKTRIGGPARI